MKKFSLFAILLSALYSADELISEGGSGFMGGPGMMRPDGNMPPEGEPPHWG